MKRLNLDAAPLYCRADKPPAYATRAARIGEPIGAEHLGGQLIELDPGQLAAPYHWEAGREEWLIVLDGHPTVRTAEGEQELRPGDVACFPAGPSGAHQVANHGTQPARIVMLSDRTTPNVIAYPDSGKVGTSADDLRLMFRADSAVDYWEGEG